MLEFQAVILGTSGGGAYIETPVNTDVEAIFGQKRPKIKATFEGKVAYRGTLTRMKTTQHILIVRKDIRAQLNKNVGDTISVLIELDKEERVVELPSILKSKLDENPSTAAIFDKLSYTCKKEYVDYILQAKKEETRQRRTEKVMQQIAEQK